MSSELREKIETILEKIEIPERHSYFQIEKFIIGKEVTIQGQLWQIIRELKARKETVDSYIEQLENAVDELELLDIKIEKHQIKRKELILEKKEDADQVLNLNIREIEINIKKLERQKSNLNNSIENVKKKIKFTLEESRFFVSAFEELEKIEKVKSLDDREAQVEFWNEKLLEEFNLRVLLRTSLDPEFIKTIMALNDEAPVKKHVTSMLQQIQKNMIMKNSIALEKMEQGSVDKRSQ
jgi:hypothetical protein